jgi:hypothetical protein
MPETFRDAISASRQLGAQYLWIDSLCIIQDKDDLTDWAHEVSMMSKVYSNSLCNLSASDTDGDTPGLFRSRDVQNFIPITVQYCTDAFTTATNFIECELIDHRLWEDNVGSCPIQERGWVFQERVLAPRILHFGHDQLFWECREQRSCEQYPHGLPESIIKLYSASFKKRIDIGKDLAEPTQQGSITQGSEGLDPYYEVWNEVVWDYSSTTLTNPTDKLIALSGVARSFANITGDSYVAGMWRKNLEYKLSWSTSRGDWTAEEIFPPRPAIWRAPTWSWASVDTSIDYRGCCANPDDDLLYATVQDVVLTHATGDETGLLTGGWLDLRGTLRPTQLTQARKLRSGIHYHRWEIPKPFGAEEDERNSPVALDIETSNPSAFDDDNAQGNLFLMPLSSGRTYSDTVSTRHLVLRIVDRQKPLFERVGLVTVRCPGNLGVSLKDDISEEEKSRLPCLQYHDDGTHTVRIV